MRSPICHLESSIAGVAFQIAPERETESVLLRDKHGIDIELIDDTGFSIRVDLKTNTIRIPIAALEYLWSFSHYTWVLVDEYRAAQPTGAKQFDCLGNSRLAQSNKLLEWAKSNLLADGNSPWPKSAPAPTRSVTADNDVVMANEMFLCALGWIVHHEIGHIALGHSHFLTNLAVREEQEADDYATDWLLSALGPNDQQHQKRALGVAVAILCIQSTEIHTNACPANTHPDAHERIFACLSKVDIDLSEPVNAYASVVLQFLFHDQNIKTDVDGESFGAILDDLLVSIARSKGT